MVLLKYMPAYTENTSSMDQTLGNSLNRYVRMRQAKRKRGRGAHLLYLGWYMGQHFTGLILI